MSLMSAHVAAARLQRGICWLLTMALLSRVALSTEVIPSFDHDIMAILSRAGCNMGACHGNLNGKGGLQLSLRGQDSWHDYLALTHDWSGRRIDRNDPDQSLMLLKPTSGVPHQGGQRIVPGTPEHRILRAWIAAGTPGPDPHAAQLRQLDVTPRETVMPIGSDPVQLRVTATFSDATQRDVTQLATYDVSNFVASVTPAGQIRPEEIGETSVSVRYLNGQVCVRLAFVPEKRKSAWTATTAQNWIDQPIADKLRRLGVPPVALAEDTVFVRRIFLDVLGRLPTRQEAEAFCTDSRPEKRAALIDALLCRPEFADFWALKWSDLLRNEEKLLDHNGVQAFHTWIRNALAANMPLDEFVRQLIAARGSTYANPPANFYRALRDPLTRGETTAQLFLGVRLQCEKCHNHPFDVWTQDDYYAWAGLFARIDYEIVENNRKDKFDKQEFVGEQKVILKDEGEVTNARTGEPAQPRFFGADAADRQPT